MSNWDLSLTLILLKFLISLHVICLLATFALQFRQILNFLEISCSRRWLFLDNLFG